MSIPVGEAGSQGGFSRESNTFAPISQLYEISLVKTLQLRYNCWAGKVPNNIQKESRNREVQVVSVVVMSYFASHSLLRNGFQLPFNRHWKFAEHLEQVNALSKIFLVSTSLQNHSKARCCE